MGLDLETIAQPRAEVGILRAPLRISRPCGLRRLNKPALPQRRLLQRLQPQALAFGGLAPANLQTELEALERSQGISQV